MPPKNARFEVRFEADTLERIDRWAERQSDHPNRSDAVRRLVEKGLELSIDDGARLSLMMLRDIHKALNIKHPEVDPDFIAEALWGGHYWALEWQYTGLFHDHVDDRADLKLVVDVLDMWMFIEEGYKGLSAADKKMVERDADPFGKHVRFSGFDGNYEAEKLSIARFLIEKMGRFQEFKGRDLNSHVPLTGAYERMLSVFEPIKRTMFGRTISAKEIVELLKAKRAPGP